MNGKHLLASWGKKKEKITSEGKRKEKKNSCVSQAES